MCVSVYMYMYAVRTFWCLFIYVYVHRVWMGVYVVTYIHTEAGDQLEKDMIEFRKSEARPGIAGYN